MAEGRSLILQAANSSWEAKGSQHTFDQNTLCLSPLFLSRRTLHLLGILLGQRWFLWCHQMVQPHSNQEEQMFSANIRGSSWMLWCSARKTPLGPSWIWALKPPKLKGCSTRAWGASFYNFWDPKEGSCIVFLFFLSPWVLLCYRMALKFHYFLSLSCPNPWYLCCWATLLPNTFFLSGKSLSRLRRSPVSNHCQTHLRELIPEITPLQGEKKREINSLYKALHGGHVELFEGSTTWIGCKFQRSWGHWKCWFLSQSRRNSC